MEIPTKSDTTSIRFLLRRFHAIAFFYGFLAIVIFLSVAPVAFAQPDDAKRLVSLLDYLGSDYKNAVKDGKILSADEYTEMQEFSKRSQELFNQLKQADKADKAGVESTIKSLAGQIEKKADPQSVAELAKSAKDKLIAAYNIVPYPKQLPSWDSGRQLYAENCAKCHGETGKGDGPGVSSMNPKNPPPANFTDPERMAGLSPFKGFNTASFGIEGTAMASFAALSEEQRWQVAFYVMSLRFSHEQAAAGEAMFRAKKLPPEMTSAATLATSSDEQLGEKLKSYFGQAAEVNQGLAFLRRGVLERGPADPLILTRSLVREAADLYTKGQKEKAYQKAVEAYI
ncbi:MAG: c-type cytochrome, partial [Candidatus Binatia bacterium]